jgi:hypothetical protein
MKINAYRERYLKISKTEKIGFKVPIYCCNCYNSVSYNTVLSDIMIPYKQYPANIIRNYIFDTFHFDLSDCSRSSIYNWKLWFNYNKYQFLDTYLFIFHKSEYQEYYFSSSYKNDIKSGKTFSKICYLANLFKVKGYR